jgi:hypothetical protein
MRHIALLLSLVLSPLVATADPTLEWVSAGGGTKNDKTRAICFDRTGSVFLAGEMTGDGKFADIEVKSLGDMDFVLAKLDANGRFQWVRTLGGSKTDRGYGVATDAAGNAYVTGHFQSTDAVVNGAQLPNAGDYDVFVARYDPDGKLLWIRTAGGAGYDYGHGIAVDSAGDVVVSGAVVGPAQFGETAAAVEGRAVFCAKYSPDGNLKWVKTTGGKASGSGHGVAVDGSNNIYVGGSLSGTGTFGSQTVTGTGAFAAKLSPEGEVQWVAQTEGGGAHEITADAQGRVWLAGMFKGKAKIGTAEYSSTGDKDNDGFIVHLTNNGAFAWSRVISSPGVDYCLGVTTDGNGTAYVCGEFTGEAQFAGQNLASRGATDVQIGALDESGRLLWLTQVGGAKGDNAFTMAYHPSGHILLGGACIGPAAFGDKEVTATAGPDMYGAKVRVK